MSDTASARREFGEGPLARVAAFCYTLVVVELLFLLVTAPGLVVMVFLARDASNLPLVALCALPIGPALSAALFALHHRRGDLTDLRPLPAFWRGYRLNALSALKLWVPWLVWLTIVGLTLANFGAAGVPRWWAILLVVIAVAVTLLEASAMVITSLFAFRTVDIVRLSGYFLARTPSVALGNVCLLLLAAGVVALSSEAVLALFASVFALTLLRFARPMTEQIRREFTG
jgi:hypothetical protein